MDKKYFQDNNPKRQKLINPLPELTAAPEALTTSTKKTAKGGSGHAEMAMIDIEWYVKDIAHLKEMLLTALKLELSTIPPYLCALYTIKDGSNHQAAGLIRSVVVEEMLHMVLVANILNAITDHKKLPKGEKLFDVKKIIASYPTALPGNIIPEVPKGNPPFKVSLRKFSIEAIDDFCTIERPSNPNKSHNADAFDGIGQFYQAIRFGLKRLNESTPGGIFKGNEDWQIKSEHYYGSGGKIIPVKNYADAEEAIGEIVGQGEGIDETIMAEDVMFGQGIEYAHFFKFREIAFGRMYSPTDTNFQATVKSIPTGAAFDVSWSSVYNMKDNPKMADYKSNPELLAKAEAFNKVYVSLLNIINDAVSGEPERLKESIHFMYELKYKAQELLNIPLSNGECAGPTFEYVKP